MSRYIGYYDCCEHCDPRNEWDHPMLADRHIGSCPKGCNDDAVPLFGEASQ
jgi:hypothetical protein